jgi:hypothetical protein
MYVWKCHSETPCITTINQQKMFFFKKKKKNGRVKTSSVQRWIPVVGGESTRKR